GQSDAEVDVLSVAQLGGHPRGQLVSRPCHLAPLLLITASPRPPRGWEPPLCIVVGAVMSAPSPARFASVDWARAPPGARGSPGYAPRRGRSRRARPKARPGRS